MSDLEYVENIDPVRAFWNQSVPCGAGFPEDMPALDASTLEELFISIRDELRVRLPEGWWHGPVPQLSDNHGESLDQLFQKLLKRSDYWTETARYQTALCSTCWQLNGDRLANLVQPANGGDELLELPLLGMSISELQAELSRWRNRYLRGIPSRISWDGDRLGIWLALLLQPSVLQRHPWEEVVRHILVDRTLARAGAFVAWRIEQLERLSSHGMSDGRNAALTRESR